MDGVPLESAGISGVQRALQQFHAAPALRGDNCSALGVAAEDVPALPVESRRLLVHVGLAIVSSLASAPAVRISDRPAFGMGRVYGERINAGEGGSAARATE